MFKIRMQNEKIQIDKTNKKGVFAYPIKTKAKEKTINEANKGIRLSNLETNHPEKGNPIIELIGIAKRMVPNCASLKSKNSLMVGIRDAQEAKQIPDRKK